MELVPIQLLFAGLVFYTTHTDSPSPTELIIEMLSNSERLFFFLWIYFFA